MAGKLQGKTALVTGASRGIGRAIAVKLASEGAMVAVNYASNEAAGKETLRLVEAAGGKGFLAHSELGSPESAEKLAKIVEAELTKRNGSPALDILVNNVGGADYATLAQTTPELYKKTLDNNVGSAFFLTRAERPHLRKGGAVINLSSAGARLALESLIIYSMSKGAINIFTQALAKELGPRGITVNAVAPGFIATDGAAADIANEDAVAYMKANTALARPYGEPEEIAAVVHGLATNMTWVTGQIIEASGGFRM
jgi:3-oxoacyl-[acyl-carrier protein] reductase